MKKIFLLSAVIAFFALGSCVLGLDTGSGENDIGTVSWGKTAEEWRDDNGRHITMTLPPGGTSHSVWGTDMYTDDSCIGTAAVHAGLIGFQNGGTVTIEIHPGQSSYTGSDRNGVHSGSWGSYSGSFNFVR